eukprot:3107841-Rhodomonas_salina.3
MFELFRFTLRHDVTAAATDNSNSGNPNYLEGEDEESPLWVNGDGSEMEDEPAVDKNLENSESRRSKTGPSLPQVSEQDKLQGLVVGGFLPQDAKQAEAVFEQPPQSQQQADAQPPDAAAPPDAKTPAVSSASSEDAMPAEQPAASDCS